MRTARGRRSIAGCESKPMRRDLLERTAKTCEGRISSPWKKLLSFENREKRARQPITFILLEDPTTTECAGKNEVRDFRLTRKCQTGVTPDAALIVLLCTRMHLL